MRLWALISLSPHSYLLAICAMADRIDINFWFRLVGMNAIWFTVLVWQRRATTRTMAELSELGAAHSSVAVVVAVVTELVELA